MPVFIANLQRKLFLNLIRNLMGVAGNMRIELFHPDYQSGSAEVAGNWMPA
ncbi:MAG: hypothetical protein OEN02_18300 [Gammaproteobacteria bacterium]|nr:hypothetical protein [Gammaproteobacteria bacterium]MDH3537363.1 hypothetical protein [Gammaproteobacteria bacterium]